MPTAKIAYNLDLAGGRPGRPRCYGQCRAPHRRAEVSDPPDQSGSAEDRTRTDGAHRHGGELTPSCARTRCACVVDQYGYWCLVFGHVGDICAH